jgi:hypothetical protein
MNTWPEAAGAGIRALLVAIAVVVGAFFAGAALGIVLMNESCQNSAKDAA